MSFIRNLTGYKLLLPPHKRCTQTRRQRIVETLRYANTQTPFYKQAFDRFLDNQETLSDTDFFYAYSHLPIVEKHHLRDHNEAFMSDPLKDKNDLLLGGNTPSPIEFIKSVLIKKDFMASLSTGGTSGTPTYRYIDYNDAVQFAQSFLHSFELNGWQRGEDFVVFYPLKSYFTNAYAQQEKALRRHFGFTMVPFEEINKGTVEQLIRSLRKTKAKLLVIFPCVLQRVAEIIQQENLGLVTDLPYINVSGEFFLDCSKKFIQSVFPDSDIQSTYGAVEFGEIAHQKGLSSTDYDVFDDFVYLEQGPQNSILVTTLSQKAFPLIRYKIEDMGQVVTDHTGKQSIMNLEGKNTDFLTGSDGYIYFASFFNEMINKINEHRNETIIHFMLRHDTHTENGLDHHAMQLNFVLNNAPLELQETIRADVFNYLGTTFSNFQHIEVNFPDYFEHDYTRKFKIIGEGDGLAEVVGGYYAREAS